MTAFRSGPLSHLRVLDFTQFLSGPFGTQVLGDLGAEVIKVEAPDGDMTRRLPPHFVGGQSAYYLSINRNKKSLAIDMKSESGKKLVRDLALVSDVVVENFRPGVLERLGLSYTDISASKPGIVWASISGFGQDGPYRDRPAYDMIVQALSGGMSLTGEPAGRPVRSGVPIGDLAAGLYAVIGILAAIEARNTTGKGEKIDISMLDCQLAMLTYQAAYYLKSGDVPARQGAGHDSIPTYRSFSCGDGHEIVMTANTERMWQRLCTVLGHDEWATDPRFVDNAHRYRNRHALWPLLELEFLKRDAQAWADRLIAAEIPAAVVNTLDLALNDPQALHRNMVLSLTREDGVTAEVAGNPIKLAGQSEDHSFPPTLGGDAEAILADVLNLDRKTIADLRASGVIASPTERAA